MITVAFAYPDERMPRTVFYEKLSGSIKALHCFVDQSEPPDLIFPQEDTSMETNWPRYGRPDTAFLRGRFDLTTHYQYLNRLIAAGRPMCIINMHPFLRLPLELAAFSNVMVADINLLTWERSINPRTISMPAFPITVGSFNTEARQVLVSFRGTMSHPCRQALREIDNGSSIIVDIVAKENHFGQIDAETQETDIAYVELLENSVFALVPRGDTEFSYRLLEVMSFGCIPIIISDGLIPPFDRLINWEDCAIRIPENRITRIPDLIGAISPGRIAEMQLAVRHIYSTYLGGFTEVATSIVTEAAMILSRMHRQS